MEEVVSDIAGNRGVILGKLNGKAVCLPEKTRMNHNVAVFGASGSMKSRAYARNVVFQCVIAGNAASGKDEIIQAVNDMGKLQATIIPKYTSRMQDEDDGSEMICQYVPKMSLMKEYEDNYMAELQRQEIVFQKREAAVVSSPSSSPLFLFNDYAPIRYTMP